METLGQRIKRLRNAKRISQKALAEACGWESQSRIGNYESGTRTPSIADLLLIAPALGVTLADLAEDVPRQETYGANNEVKEHATREDLGAWTPSETVAGTTLAIGVTKDGAVPVVGQAKLGVDGYFEAIDFPVGHGDGYLMIHSDDPNAYGLKVLGDSMHPRIKNGEYVLIEPNKVFCSGDEVMVKTVDGRAMIKEFIYQRDGMYRFDSVNQSHPPIHLPEDAIDKIHLVGGILKSSRFTHDYHAPHKK